MMTKPEVIYHYATEHGVVKVVRHNVETITVKSIYAVSITQKISGHTFDQLYAISSTPEDALNAAFNRWVGRDNPFKGVSNL